MGNEDDARIGNNKESEVDQAESRRFENAPWLDPENGRCNCASSQRQKAAPHAAYQCACKHRGIKNCKGHEAITKNIQPFTEAY
jgi:hypothetical protein